MFHSLSIIAHGLNLSNPLSEYTNSLARIERKFIATHETEPMFLYMPIKSETYSLPRAPECSPSTTSTFRFERLCLKAIACSGHGKMKMIRFIIEHGLLDC